MAKFSLTLVAVGSTIHVLVSVTIVKCGLKTTCKQGSSPAGMLPNAILVLFWGAVTVLQYYHLLKIPEVCSGTSSFRTEALLTGDTPVLTD